MLIHGKMDRTTANGPGLRAAIWFQGCLLNCPGCHNPGTHPFDMSRETPFPELTTWIQGLDADVTGVTFSGGEPLQHFPDLLQLCRYIREVKPAYSIGMFTGYTGRELETGNWDFLHTVSGPVGIMRQGNGELWAELCKYLDWAVMGRFNASKMTTAKPLCGSSNQEIVCFSDRHTAGDFQPQECNVTVSPNGLITITGFPGVETIQAMQSR